MRLAYSEVESVLKSVLLRNGFSADNASLCARLFAETTLDGVYSHGLNRFPLFIDAVQRGVVIPDCEPTLVRALNNFECWDGNLGPGNLNAWFCMGRAVDLAGIWYCYRVPAEHESLDARRNLRHPGGSRELHRYLHDQHYAEHAALG